MDYNDIEIAKRFEANSEWSAAADMWDRINRVDEANACRNIAEAIRKGDMYRKDCAKIEGKYNLGLISKKKYVKKLSKLHKKHFN